MRDTYFSRGTLRLPKTTVRDIAETSKADLGGASAKWCFVRITVIEEPVLVFGPAIG